MSSSSMVMRYARHHGHILDAGNCDFQAHTVEFVAHGNNHVAVGDFDGAFGGAGR